MAELVHRVACARSQEEAADTPILVLQAIHDLSPIVLRPLIRVVDIRHLNRHRGLHGADWSMSMTLN